MTDKKSNPNKNEAALENSHEVKMMREVYEKGGLTRREFMQGVVAAGLSAAAATAFVNASYDIRAMTRKRGGKIRWATNQHGPDDSMDPALITSGPDDARSSAHFNSLVRFNEDLSVRPELAAEWSSNDANTEYTFKLRDDVKFTDGKPLDVEDVLYSMRRHIGEDSMSVASGMVQDVTAWEKVDNTTVRATLATPNPDLPQILSTTYFRVTQADALNIPGYFDLPVGTGPYICKEFSPGVRAVHVRNEDYWREPPGPDELETFAITDGDARTNALLSGDVEMVATLPPSGFEAVEETPGVELFNQESGPFHNIAIMQDRFPGNNVDFVLAVKYIQDRERVVRTFLRGEGAVANDHPISKQYPEYCPEVEQRPYDLDKAKFHWQKSGLSTSDLPTLYFGPTDPGMIETGLMLQAESAKIGMDLPIKQVPGDGYWNLYPHNYPMIGSGWSMQPTANMVYTEIYSKDSGDNETYWANPRFNELLVAARTEKDQGVFMEMQCEMQQLISDDAATPIPAFRNFIDGISSKVKGTPRIALGPLGNHDWPEWVWLDS